MDPLVSKFADLFEGRKDAYGADHGECIRIPFGLREQTWEALWPSHLDGSEPIAIGIYPVSTSSGIEAMVKWGCVDIDVEDLNQAKNLRTALNVLDLPSWIERSKSKGYHVWVFAQDWVPAATMRRALLVACKASHVPADEVNPKQETLGQGQLGNYVRLPYPGHLGVRADYARRVVLSPHDDQVLLNLPEFVEAAWRNKVRAKTLGMAASLWKPPKKAKVSWDAHNHPVKVGPVTEKLDGLTWTIYTDGPLDDDRSKYLYKLAAGCKRSGLVPTEALTIVTAADEAWGQKYVNRPDAEKMLRLTVERAYAELS